MWNDNEADVDLLGFDQLVDTLVYLVQQQGLLPLTIGVFGDWGSGKSSLMGMARTHLTTNPRYVCVSFSPWQHEDYDDVKTALMVAVMTALRDHQNLREKVGGAVVAQTQRLWEKVIKRVNWLRAISFTAKGIGGLAMLAHGQSVGAGLAAGGLGDLSQILRPDTVADLADQADTARKEILAEPKDSAAGSDGEPIEQSVGEFRHDFAALLQDLEIDALVIFIDDLDRCLPPNIIDMLEVVRLFLAVPKTAFILGADERIIRHAIATRYPELPGQAVSIGRDYLEKIVQIPIRIPPLTAEETETYLNLLGCQLYLEHDDGARLVEIAAANRRKAALAVAMNYGVAQTHLPTVPLLLDEHMQLIGRIAPTLCGGLQGNPRQTKRFMNTLLLRQQMAAARGVTLDSAILAKLMILEYFHESYFRQLFQWQAEGGGYPDELVTLESRAADTGDGPPRAAGIADDLLAWLTEKGVRDWLRLEPQLAEVDLAPYFYFSRDRVFTPTAPSRRLSQPLQELLGKLQSESDAVRRQGLKQATTLAVEEFRPVYDMLLGQFQRNPRALDDQLGGLLVTLAVQQRELVPALAQTLRTAPLGSIQPALALTIRTQFGAGTPLPREMEDVLQFWGNQSTAPNLARAAQQTLTSRRPR